MTSISCGNVWKCSHSVNNKVNWDRTEVTVQDCVNSFICDWSCNYHGIQDIRHLLTTERAQTLVYSLILSRINYCNDVLQQHTAWPQRLWNCDLMVLYKYVYYYYHYYHTLPVFVKVIRRRWTSINFTSWNSICTRTFTRLLIKLHRITN